MVNILKRDFYQLDLKTECFCNIKVQLGVFAMHWIACGSANACCPAIAKHLGFISSNLEFPLCHQRDLMPLSAMLTVCQNLSLLL